MIFRIIFLLFISINFSKSTYAGQSDEFDDIIVFVKSCVQNYHQMNQVIKDSEYFDDEAFEDDIVLEQITSLAIGLVGEIKPKDTILIQKADFNRKFSKIIVNFIFKLNDEIGLNFVFYEKDCKYFIYDIKPYFLIDFPENIVFKDLSKLVIDLKNGVPTKAILEYFNDSLVVKCPKNYGSKYYINEVKLDYLRDKIIKQAACNSFTLKTVRDADIIGGKNDCYNKVIVNFDNLYSIAFVYYYSRDHEKWGLCKIIFDNDD